MFPNLINFAQKNFATECGCIPSFYGATQNHSIFYGSIDCLITKHFITYGIPIAYLLFPGMTA